jgi:uracil-DNA glycosylase
MEEESTNNSSTLQDIVNKTESFFNSTEQYLVVLASCLGKSIDLAKKEPMLAAVINRFPWITVYEENQKHQPGTFRIYGDGIKQRKVIVVFGQMYPGRMDYPQDNKNKRLEWFVSALNSISEIEDLKSISFPTQISRDCGGNWSYYYMAIKEFAQTLHLKTEIPVVLYQNDLVSDDEMTATQISLLNCINLNTATSLESLCFASNLLNVTTNTDHLSSKPKKILLNHNKLKERLRNEKATTDSHSSGRSDGGKTDGRSDGGKTDGSDNPNKKNHLVLESVDPDEDINDKVVEGEVRGVDEILDEKMKIDDSEIMKAPIKKMTLRKFGKKANLDEISNSSSNDDLPAVVDTILDIKESDNHNSVVVEDGVKKVEKVMSVGGLELEAFPETELNKDWNNGFLVNPEVDESWRGFFQTEEIQKKLAETHLKLWDELDRYGTKSKFLPTYDLVFNAFKLCTFDNLKVVILAQDPYPDEKNAMGLAFSVPESAPVARSLHTIYAELMNEYPDTFLKPKHGCLKKWAEQGVLLLNSALTLRAGESNSHQGYWKGTTDLIIKQISKTAKHPVIFMLWGNDAKAKKKIIDCERHIVLEAVHPSPINGRAFIGCKHFSDCNKALEKMGRDIINWQV